MPSTVSIGADGEEKVVSILISKGAIILARNFHSRNGEIDIIAKRNGLIYFIEVRLRNSRSFGTAGESITGHKQHKIIRTAHYWILKNRINQEQIGGFYAALLDWSWQHNRYIVKWAQFGV